MDLQVTSESWGNVDRSWLASRLGMDQCRSITLDLALFDEATHYPDGHIPDGMTLGLVTATGRYGPYDDALATGQEVLAGHLFNPVKVNAGATRAGAALYWMGIVRRNRLPLNHGLDAAGEADVAAHIRYEG